MMRVAQLLLLVLGTLVASVGAWYSSSPEATPGKYAIRRAGSPVRNGDGRILVPINGKDTVQVYTPSGSYAGALSVPALRGAFRLRRNTDESIEVALARSARVYQLDAASGVGASRDDPGAFNSFGESSSTTALAAGDVFIRGDSIVVRSPGGASRVIHTQETSGWDSAVRPELVAVAGLFQIALASTIRLWWGTVARMARYRHRPLLD